VTASVLVVGQLARDLVLRVPELPEPGGSAVVDERRELLGGKGANQAVGLRQLGAEPVTVMGVVGDDFAGSWVLDRARASGLDVGPVIRRGRTALLVDVVADGVRRLLEDVPTTSLLRAEDVARSAGAFAEADTVSIQLQQPADAVLAAAQLAHEHGARLALDGAAPPGARDRLLALADVVRADATEAESWTGRPVRSVAAAEQVAAELVAAGPAVVAVAVPDAGDLVAWPGGSELVPFGDDPVVDPTGAGDAFVAGLLTALRRGEDARSAGRFARRTSGRVVRGLGGRPDLGGPDVGGPAR
jgi:ribokinase